MKQTVVPLWRFSGLCTNGHTFVAHQFPDFEYGRGLARTARPGEMAMVDCLDDPIHDEVADMVKSLTRAAGKGNWYGRCFQAVYGQACDPAPSGELYGLTQPVRCPACGTSDLVRYGPGEPPVVDEVELPLVTHENWEELTAAEKLRKIEMALTETGCVEWPRPEAE